MTLNSVVLPAPLGPMRPKIWPGWISNVTSPSAVRPPNCIVSPSISSKGFASMRTPFEIGVTFGDVAERLLLQLGSTFSAPGPQPPGDDALRPEEHHEHQHDTEV